jgi:DNA-directed RNA polymerase specialized sigma subunit
MENKLTLDELFKLRDEKQEKLQTNREQQQERRREILQLHLVDGMSMIDIGKKFNITRARVHQIITESK